MALKDSTTSLGSLGNYDLVDKLGEGSMGTVYKARHWTTGDVVAIKVMPSNIARKPMLLKRFEQEFRIASRVEHPNVVRVLEYCGRGTEPYLVMEFVDGVSLGDRLERQGRLAEAEALNLITQVADGLHHSHELGLLHRDVKPDNILVTTAGVAKLTDLGLAKEMDAVAELTRTGTGLGTPNFMAPEQFRNAKNADVRCDVYSLGATLYMMVTGELPFGQGDPVRILMNKLSNTLTPLHKLVPMISERIERAILRAMDPEPERRPASCREFVDELLGRPSPAAAPAAEAAFLPAADTLHGRPGEIDLAKTHPLRRSGGNPSTGAMPRAEIDARLARYHVNPPQPAAAPAVLAPAGESANSSTVPNFVVPLSSQKHLRPQHEEPEVVAAAPAAPASESILEGWKTLLIVLATGVVTIVVSHLLFLK